MGDLLSHQDFQADKMARVRLVNNVAPASRLLENMAQLPQAVHVSAYGLTEISGSRATVVLMRPTREGAHLWSDF